MKRAATDHPKMAELAEAIAAEYKHHSKFAMLIAVGVLEKLWHFTAKFAPRGDIGRRTNQQIGRWVDWPKGDEDNLIRLLLATNWLQSDHNCRLIVHDWAEHADDSVKRLLKRNGLSFACPDMSSLPEPEPEPEPIYISSPTGLPSIESPPFDAVGRNGNMPLAEWTLLPETITAPDRRESWFEEFWGVYGKIRNADKQAAKRAFMRAVQSETKFRHVMQRLELHRPGYLAREWKNRPHASTWLNGARYDDDPDPVPTETSTWTTPPDEMILR